MKKNDLAGLTVKELQNLGILIAEAITERKAAEIAEVTATVELSTLTGTIGMVSSFRKT